MRGGHTVLRVVVALVIAVTLAGCGGSAGSADAVDACKLITQADAEAILGAPVAAPEIPISGEGVALVTSCKYAAKDNPTANVTLVVRQLSSAAAAAKDFAQLKQDTATQMKVTTVNIAGSGDAAFWAGGATNELAVLRGKTQLLISVKGAPGATADAAAKSLAATALGRLK